MFLINYIYLSLTVVVTASGAYSLVVHGLLIAAAPRCRAQALGHVGFSSCGSSALECGLSSCDAPA